MNHERKKAVIFLFASLCLCLFAGAGTVAFLRSSTRTVVNEFVKASVDGEIVESFREEMYKEDVYFRSSSDLPVYVRARMVAVWQDSDGNISGKKPVCGTDYVLIRDASSGWTEGSDGYWYYSTVLPAGESTGNLIDICYEAAGAEKPFGCHLVVDVLAQAIQAEPSAAVTEAWGVSVNTDGTLSVGP